MPAWAQIIIGVAAIIIACGVIWSKVLKPGAELVALMGKVLPLLREMANQFENAPSSFKILQEIVAQFRTDSGSSLRDVVNRLEAAADENRSAAKVLKVDVEAARRLAEQDRVELAEVLAMLKKTVASDKVVAADLKESQAHK